MTKSETGREPKNLSPQGIPYDDACPDCGCYSDESRRCPECREAFDHACDDLNSDLRDE